MSMLWAPQNPRGFSIYGYQGKAGYSLMNVFDSKAGGAMVVAALPEGRPLWGDTAEQLENQEEEKKRQDSGEVPENPYKRPSNSSFLEYVVVSDTLFGLDAGVKRSERDPDDDATFTEIMKKKKALEDKKKELEAQAAAALAENKSKLQKETATAPSESEIDLGVFSAKTGNLLEKMYKSASGSRASKSGKSTRKVDISHITPPESPPSRTFDLSPPPPHAQTRRGKGRG
ncbi:hypothetical protein Hdeb2414_s0010g00344621 [Helianthus debilis subsp. tardiflorus]